MTDLPDGVARYSRSPTFTEETVPAKLTRRHNTKAGVWGRINVVSGSLEYVEVGHGGRTTTLNGGDTAIVEPTVEHYVSPRGAVSFFIEFYR